MFQNESFRNNVKTMTNDDKTKDKNLEYNINKEAAKIPALSSGRIVFT